jgi:quercetin dioxygenase-like cupin family protein
MTDRDQERVSPFGTWTGRDPFPIFPGVSLHATGGEQVLLCRVSYEPGTTVKRHAHEHTEQLMAIVDGEVEVTIGGETRTLGAGDVCVMNRGVEHELRSQNGVTFFEALSPVPLDHVDDPERDLVLGPDGGKLHVER